MQLSAYMLKTESGLDWEIIVQVAIVLRMIQAQFTGSTGAFDLIDIDSCPNVSILSLSSQCLSLAAARTEIENEIAKHHGEIVVVATPTYSKFPDFDGFICHRNIANDVDITGYQVKLGRTYPKHDKPEWIKHAWLIRGRAPSSRSVRKGWHYLDEYSIRDLLGSSLQYMYPSNWPEIPEYDSFD